MAGNPQARPANLALLNAFLLRDDPFGRTVVDVGAGGHAVGEMKLADPFPVVAMPVDQPRQHRLALGIDHLRAARNRDLAALADFLDAPVVENNNGIFNRRPPGAVDQRAADDGDGSSLRPKRRGEKQADEQTQKNRSTKFSIEHPILLLVGHFATIIFRLIRHSTTPILQHSNPFQPHT